MARIIAAFTQFFDDNGDPLVDGWLKFNESGTNNTDKGTFADVNQTIANTNPLQLDGAGRCPNVFGSGTYNVISYTDNNGTPGVQIQQFDPVSGEAVEGAFSSWSASVIYDAGDIVTADNGLYYRALSTNQNQEPSASAGQWEEITFNRIWNTNVTYDKADTVYGSDGYLYRSRDNSNTGNDPTASSAFWSKITGNLVTEVLDYTFASDSDKTLTADENEYGKIDITGAVLTAPRNLIVSDKERVLHVDNAEGFAITVKTFAGTGISVPSGNAKALVVDGTNVVELAETASQSEVDVGTDTVKTVTPNTLANSIQTAQAWVNFNGTGVVAIRDSFNVSSITDNGTGNYTVNFTNAIANANYCVLGCGSIIGTAGQRIINPDNYLTTSVDVIFKTDGNLISDPDFANVAVLAD